MTRAVSRAFPPEPPLESDTPSEDRVPNRPASRSRRGHHRDRFTPCKHVATGFRGTPTRRHVSLKLTTLFVALFRIAAAAPSKAAPFTEVKAIYEAEASFLPAEPSPSNHMLPSMLLESRRPSVGRSRFTASCVSRPVDFRALLRRRVRDDSRRCQRTIIRSFLGFLVPFEVYLPPAAGLTLPKKPPDPAPWPKPGCVCPVGGVAASPKRCNNLPGDFRRQRTADELGFVGSLPKK